VTHISGITTFSEPGTFRIKRTPDGMIRITTNTGVSFADQWLGGSVKRIEVLTLDHQWLDVTAQCQHDSIPLEVVREWQGRNQRTLVDFRING